MVCLHSRWCKKEGAEETRTLLHIALPLDPRRRQIQSGCSAFYSSLKWLQICIWNRKRHKANDLCLDRIKFFAHTMLLKKSWKMEDIVPKVKFADTFFLERKCFIEVFDWHTLHSFRIIISKGALCCRKQSFVKAFLGDYSWQWCRILHSMCAQMQTYLKPRSL